MTERIEVYRRRNIWYLRDTDGTWYLWIGKSWEPQETYRWVRLDTTGERSDTDTLRRQSMYSYSPRGPHYAGIVEAWKQSGIKERVMAERLTGRAVGE